MRRFSVYVHIPYCQAKCPYCDFNSYAAARWPEQRYAAALCAELRRYGEEPAWHHGTVRTVFFGGGTPSLFSAASIGAILEQIWRVWTPGADVEVTLEANPGTLTAQKLSDFHQVGVNRMSFGVQSFLPHHLRTLGRIHGADEGAAAVELARQAGFERVSIDLMFALPQQRLDEWESDLTRACGLHPDHISAYNLTYEEGTPFHKWRADGILRQLPEEIEVAMFTRAQEVLAGAGYRQYEISNYARPGQACRHNLNYWHGGAYLGVGAGAHSFAIGAPQLGDFGCRWSNEEDPNAYIEAVTRHGQACCSREALTERQAHGEFVFLGLRCLDGFAAVEFQKRFGLEPAVAFPHVEELCARGLLQTDGDRWRLTAPGLLLADSVFTTFL